MTQQYPINSKQKKKQQTPYHNQPAGAESDITHLIDETVIVRSLANLLGPMEAMRGENKRRASRTLVLVEVISH